MEVEFPGKTSAHTAGSPPAVGPLVRSRAPKRPKLSEMEVSTSQFQCPTEFWPTTPFSGTTTYTYVQSRETENGQRLDVELTPRQNLGIVGTWQTKQSYRRGVLLHRPATPGSQSLPITFSPVRPGWPGRRTPLRALSNVREYGEPHECSPDTLGLASSRKPRPRWPMDCRRLSSSRWQGP